MKITFINNFTRNGIITNLFLLGSAEKKACFYHLKYLRISVTFEVL